MILVANKVDLMHLRKITREQGREMATKHNVSLQDYLIGCSKSHYRHSELNSQLIWSGMKVFLLQSNVCNYVFDYYNVVAMQQYAVAFQQGQFIAETRSSAEHRAVATLWPSQNHLYKASACGEKCEIFKMREENALSWSEKVESDIRKYTQVSVGSELVKDNEVTRLLSLHKYGPPY